MKTKKAVSEVSLAEPSPEKRAKKRLRKSTQKMSLSRKTRSGSKLTGDSARTKKARVNSETACSDESNNLILAEPAVEPSIVEALPQENLPAACEFIREQAVPLQCDEVPQLDVPEHGALAKVCTACECPAEGPFVQPVETLATMEVCCVDEQELAHDTVAIGPDAAAVMEEVPGKIQRNQMVAVLATFWNLLMARLTPVWNWGQQKLKSQQGKKRLRVCESVSLGEKRFVAVIQVDGEQFLVGGSSSSVATLAHLERPREFSSIFQQHCEQDLSRA